MPAEVTCHPFPARANAPSCSVHYFSKRQSQYQPQNDLSIPRSTLRWVFAPLPLLTWSLTQKRGAPLRPTHGTGTSRGCIATILTSGYVKVEGPNHASTSEFDHPVNPARPCSGTWKSFPRLARLTILSARGSRRTTQEIFEVHQPTSIPPPSVSHSSPFDRV